LDAVGNIYFCDGASSTASYIRKISTTGIITTIAGTGSDIHSGDGGPATAAGFSTPTDIKMDAAGNLIFTAWGSHRIRKINTAGIISTIAGVSFSGFGGEGQPATATQLYFPTFLDIDTMGNIYFGDQLNHRVRRLNTSGIISTVAGSGVAAYAGDGGLATAARLNAPMGVIATPTGGVYIADWQNNVVRKVTMYDPKFVNGPVQTINACNALAVSLNTLLAVTHEVAGVTDTWSVATAPAHGTLAVSYATVSTGRVMVPTGMSYTPTTGYTGPDTFRVQVTNGTVSDITTIYVATSPSPDAGTVTGADTLCYGDTITYTSTTPWGLWISVLPAIATISPAGHLITLSAGVDTILYVHTNTCGADTARNPLFVADCSLDVLPAYTTAERMIVYPNPASNVLNITTTKAKGKLTLTDMLGREVATQAVTTGNTMVYLPALPSGIYIAAWKVEGATVCTQRVAVQR
jgi:hypothetical protein